MMAGRAASIASSPEKKTLQAKTTNTTYRGMNPMRRLNGARAVAPLALGLAATLCQTHAQAADFSQDAYTSPASPADLLWVERAAPDTGSGANVKPFGRLTLGFADDPLVLASADGSQERTLIDSEASAYLSGGLVFWRRLQLGLLVPAYLRNQGSGLGGYDVSGVVAGDPGLDLRLTLFGRQNAIELAVATTIRAPLGASGAFSSDGTVSAWPRALVSVPFGSRSFVSFVAGPTLRPSTKEQSLDVGDALKLACGVHLGLSEHWGLTAEGAGSTPFSDPFSARPQPARLAAGVRFQSGAWVAALGGGPGLTNGFGTPDFRLLASIGAQFGDDDTKPAPVETDPDHDGILVPSDRCPSVAEDKDGWQDDDGCPDLDNDGDGVEDKVDRCPTDAEDKDGWQDADGCPDLDNDGDGVLDASDRCPNEAEDKDGWQDDDGCPDPDNDGDGIPDAEDKCPSEAETKNGIDDADGCPDLLRIEAGQIRTLEPIFFETNRAKIQARSEPLLVEMANLIKSREDLGRISIEGYTDDRGSDAHNLTLSQDRAAAVMSFLVASGVDAARLESHGFGETRPIDNNKTEAGRARNRRVDFRLADLSATGSGHGTP